MGDLYLLLPLGAGSAWLAHVVTDRHQHEQIGLELAPEKIGARLGCIRESTEQRQIFVSFANSTARGHRNR